MDNDTRVFYFSKSLLHSCQYDCQQRTWSACGVYECMLISRVEKKWKVPYSTGKNLVTTVDLCRNNVCDTLRMCVCGVTSTERLSAT